MKAEKCSCGAEARIRYRMPFTWVECKKKCGLRTGVYSDWYEQRDPESEREAIQEWNRMVQDDGRTKYIHQD